MKQTVVPVVSVPAAHGEVEVTFVDAAGKPVNLGKNTIQYQQMTLNGPTLKVNPPEGASMLLNTYPLINRGGVISSPSPDVKVNGKSVTVDSREVDQSLRSAGAVAWSNGLLYVAEPRSHDGLDRYVYSYEADTPGVGDRNASRAATTAPVRRYDTVSKPTAIAVSGAALYVAGETELAAFNLKDGHRLWTQPVAAAAAVGQIALVGDRLFVPDKGANVVRVLTAKDGTETSHFSGEGDSLLKTEAGHSNIGVCAAEGDHVLVSDAFAVREFDVTGKLIRKLVDVRGGLAVARDGHGNVAVGIQWAQDPDHAARPEVWVFDAAGHPTLRMPYVYMRGPAAIDKRPSDEKYKLRYFGGLTGKVSSVGGVAFDEAGNLYVSDGNNEVKSESEFWNVSGMNSDGGVVRVSAGGQIERRIGSRYSDGRIIRQGLAARKGRPPLLRTTAAIAAGKMLRMMAWGDSITQTDAGPPAPKGWHGGASDDAHNWVHVLGRLIEQQFPPLKVHEEANGVGGQNAAESLSRNPLGPEMQQAQHDLIVLELGTNDQVFHIRTVAQFEATMREMVTALSALTDCDIVLVTPGPMFDPISTEPPANYVTALKSIGKDFGLTVVDMSAAFDQKVAAGAKPEDLLAGARNVHPNDAGHALWAQTTLDAITAVLKSAVKTKE